jgi:hypothetical protein
MTLVCNDFITTYKYVYMVCNDFGFVVDVSIVKSCEKCDDSNIESKILDNNLYLNVIIRYIKRENEGR